MRKLFAAIAVIVVLLVVADRVALVIVESRIGDSIQSQQHLQSRPQVKISGFPFLTQVVQNRFGKVSFNVATVTTSDTPPLEIDSVSAVLHDVRTSNDFSSSTVESATGSGVITYASLSQRLNTTLSWAGTGSNGRGRLKAEESVTVLGQKFTAAVSAQILLTGPNVIGFAEVQVAGVGVPQIAVSALETVFNGSLTIDNLPAGLSVVDVSAQPEGVALTLHGSNLQIK